MSTGVLDRNAYTIGWICALSVESAAAQVFLDERHQVPSDVSDSNSYVTGRIGKHNVVIAVMPQNEYGTATAATTAKDMVRSFPQVRLGLMVGIGGGAPSQEHDIRLGDVVVSSRGKGIGGVIQLDYGKTIQGQGFKETGHLNQPPTALMTAVAALDAQYDLEGPQLDEKVESALEKHRKAFKKKYARPSEDTDRLYRSEFTHPNDLSGGCPTTCGVRANDLVPRSPRGSDDDNPTIHYGLIASSNQVMKDAIKRDELAQRGILCFEMEAAGLMNHFPCLVVRGVCDYADTHKNPNWQPYAAMVAAAYAKDLLGLVKVTAVEGERKLSELIVSVISMQKENNETLKHTSNTVDEIKFQQRITNMKQWLGAVNPSDNANRAKDLRYEGTGTWFLRSSAFEDWLKDTNRHLCLYGESGCGKTVLASTVLEFLRGNRNGAKLYFFFDFRDAQKRTFEGLIRSLLFQLYELEGVSTQKVGCLRESHDYGKRPSRTGELLQCLRDVLATVEEAVILMDALDECEENNNERQKLIDWILQIGSAPDLKHVKIITTARPEAAFKKWLDPRLAGANCIELAKDAIKADIESYVKGCLKHRPGFHTQVPDHPIVKEIPGRLIQKADGMFRYAACQIDDIVSCLGPEEIENVLDALPETIQETYKRSIERIPPRQKSKAMRLLQFLLNLDEPLDLAAAVDIVSVRSDFRKFATADRICSEDIVRLCPNLLSVVEVRRYTYKGRSQRPGPAELHLAHLSVKEYLIQSDGPALAFCGMNASLSIVRTCLSYILAVHSTSERHEDKSNNRWINRQTASPKRPPFWDLAGIMLKRHAVAAEGSPETASTIAEQLQSLFKERTYEPAQWPTKDSFGVNEHASCLHFACYLGLLETTKVLATRGVDINYQPENSLSPIGIAVWMNWVEIVQFLLDFGVSPNTTHCESLHGSVLRLSCKLSRHEMTRLLARNGADLNRLEGDGKKKQGPLQIAVTQGDAELVRLLLDEGADVNAYCGYFGNALQAASSFRRVEIVETLLHRGADVNAKGGASGHALQAAVEEGYTFIIELLLNRGADINAKSSASSYALHTAIKRGYISIVELLLDKGADVNAKSSDGSHALFAAIEGGYTVIVKLLLNRGADVNAKDGAGGHALHTAIKRGYIGIVELLLDKGADVNAKSSDGSHALFAAIEGGYTVIVELLLNKGADVNVKGGAGGHALHAAVRGGHMGIVELLLDRGADVNAPSNTTDGNALQAAFQIYHETIIEILLERGAEVNADTKAYGYALEAAARRGNESMFSVLLERKANYSSGTEVCGPALKAAAESGHKYIVGLLLERGTDFDAEDNVSGRALKAALRDNHEKVVRLLLERGANTDTKRNIRNPRHSAFQVAALRGYWHIVKIFLNKGADDDNRRLETALYTAATRGNQRLIKLLLKSGADVNTQGGNLKDALHAAMAGGYQGLVEILQRRAAFDACCSSLDAATRIAVVGDQKDTVEVLPQGGADVNTSQAQHKNPLAMACIREDLQEVRYLLEHGADANARIPGSGNILYNTLHVFISRYGSRSGKHETVLKVLLEAGAEILPSTGPSCNSLRLAVERGVLEPLRLLLSYGADPNILVDASQPHLNHSLLMESLVKSQPEIAQELLLFGADPNMKTSRCLPNQTALHLAMDGGFEDVVRLLLRKGADPNELSGFPPFTPLHLSVKRNATGYVRLFLQHGADVEKAGGYAKNLTALKLAEKAGNAEIIQLLQQASTQKMSENSQ